jgi:hypothetical protein
MHAGDFMMLDMAKTTVQYFLGIKGRERRCVSSRYAIKHKISNGLRKVETRDPKTGEIVRYNADDDTTTLGELLRQEKFGAGMADQKNLDMQFAQSIMTDGGFVVSP